jgi:riboflavin biosynthesis pyrimidine reductase
MAARAVRSLSVEAGTHFFASFFLKRIWPSVWATISASVDVKPFKQGGSCLAFDMSECKNQKASKMKVSSLVHGDDFRLTIFD